MPAVSRLNGYTCFDAFVRVVLWGFKGEKFGITEENQESFYQTESRLVYIITIEVDGSAIVALHVSSCAKFFPSYFVPTPQAYMPGILSHFPEHSFIHECKNYGCLTKYLDDVTGLGFYII